MLRASKKKVFFFFWKIFRLVDPVQHHVFSKGLLEEFCHIQPFQVEIYLLLPPKSETEILELMLQRRYTSELVAFAYFF